jgi:hypothetical protein
VLRRPLESTLHAALAVVNEAAVHGSTLVQGLLQGIEDEAGMGRARHPPADNAPGIGVDPEGHIDKAHPGRDVGEVADPERIRPQCLELPVDAIERARRGLVADRRPGRLAAHGALQAHGSHQARHGAAGDCDPLSAELPPDLAHAIDPEVLLEHAPDLGFQGLVALGSRRSLPRINPSPNMGVIRRRSDRQDLADRLDPVNVPMMVDEGDHGLDRRSSSAWAK